MNGSCGLLWLLLLIVGECVGCTALVVPPDQNRFLPLEEVAQREQPVVRLYVAPIRVPSILAMHPWFLAKESGEHVFHRYEVSWREGGPYNHVKVDFRYPEQHVGAGGTVVWAELTGAEAEPVVVFLRDESINYPCRDMYWVWPGPNSNTFAQWVIDQTGWDVELPLASFGAPYAERCAK